MNANQDNVGDNKTQLEASTNSRTKLLSEYDEWAILYGSLLTLTSDGVCDVGQIFLKFNMGKSKTFTLFCPEHYPNHEDNSFFVESVPSLHMWCNTINEFIQDSDSRLSLKKVLHKAATLYYNDVQLSQSSSSSSSSSSPSSPLVSLTPSLSPSPPPPPRPSSRNSSDSEVQCEDEMLDDDLEEKCEYKLLRRKHEWRLKTQLTSATNDENTFNIFEGDTNGCSKQVFSDLGASGILMNDLADIMKLSKESGITVEVDDISQWRVFLSSFDQNSKLHEDLQQLQHKYGYNYIQLQLDFTIHLYPFSPPSIKVVRPRLQEAMMLRMASATKLTSWNPAGGMKTILNDIKDYLSTWARLDINSERNDPERFPLGSYRDIENHLFKLGSISGVAPRVALKDIVNHFSFLFVKNEGNLSMCTQESKSTWNIVPVETNTSSNIDSRWNVTVIWVAPSEKEKLLECVLQNILQELKTVCIEMSSSDLKDLLNFLESSALVPFLIQLLQIDSFLEVCQHTMIYHCVVNLIKEIAGNKLFVPLLRNLSDQKNSIYSLVHQIGEQAEVLLTNVNGTLSKDQQSESEKIIHDLYDMYQFMGVALSLPASQLELKSLSSASQASIQSVVQSDRQALKDSLFFGYNVDMEGESTHHCRFNSEMVIHTNSTQKRKIIQEIAAMSSALPFNLECAIYIRPVSGENVPIPIEHFEQSGCKQLLLDNIHKAGYIQPTTFQKHVIPIIKKGRDFVGCARTDSGYSASYLLPIIDMLLSDPCQLIESPDLCEPYAVIVCQNWCFAVEIFNEAKKYCLGSCVKTACAYRTYRKSQQEKVKGCHLLVTESYDLKRLMSHGVISFESVRFIILDVDGGRFQESVIERMMNHPTMVTMEQRQTLIFTTNFPQEIQNITDKYMGDYVLVVDRIVDGTFVKVEQEVYNVTECGKHSKLLEFLQQERKKRNILQYKCEICSKHIEFLKEEGIDRTIVFVEEDQTVDILVAYLSEQQFSVTSIRDHHIQQERDSSLADFKSGLKPILVTMMDITTDLDIRNVTHVVNYDFPKSISMYIRRVQLLRQLRNSGKTISFFVAESDAAMIKSLLKYTAETPSIERSELVCLQSVLDECERCTTTKKKEEELQNEVESEEIKD